MSLKFLHIKNTASVFPRYQKLHNSQLFSRKNQHLSDATTDEIIACLTCCSPTIFESWDLISSFCCRNWNIFFKTFRTITHAIDWAIIGEIFLSFSSHFCRVIRDQFHYAARSIWFIFFTCFFQLARLVVLCSEFQSNSKSVPIWSLCTREKFAILRSFVPSFLCQKPRISRDYQSFFFTFPQFLRLRQMKILQFLFQSIAVCWIFQQIVKLDFDWF